MSGDVYAFGPFVLEAGTGRLLRDGKPLPIGSRGLTLLAELVRARNEVVGRDALLQAAWPDTVVEDSNLSVQIAALRKLLGPTQGGGHRIASVARSGYRFIEPVTRLAPTGGEPVDRTAIEVEALVSLDHSPHQQALASGLTEEIAAALARFRWFSVMRGRTDASGAGHAAYRLEGSIRGRDRPRIAVQLVDTRTGALLWSEKYDLPADHGLEIEDEIAARVAGAIEPELLRSDAALAAARSAERVTALDLVRQGTWRFHQVTRTTHLDARELFRRAVELAPHLPEARVWLARVDAGLIGYGWSVDVAADAREGIEAGLMAIRLDEKNPYAHYGLAIASAYGGDMAQAVRAAEAATELSPSFALGHLVLGAALLFSGDAAAAIAPLERGLTLNPFDPQNFAWDNFLALARLFAGNADAAADAAEHGRKVRPDWRPIHETAALAEIARGRLETARAIADHARTLPTGTGNALAPLLAHNPAWRARIETDLRSVGLRD